MPVKWVEVKFFKEEYICDICGKGFMRPNGSVIVCYPDIIFEEVSNDG